MDTITIIQATLPNSNGLQLIAIRSIWSLFHQSKQSADHVLPDLVALAWNAALLVSTDFPLLLNIFVLSKDVKNPTRDPLIYEITWKHIKIKQI